MDLCADFLPGADNLDSSVGVVTTDSSRQIFSANFFVPEDSVSLLTEESTNDDSSIQTLVRSKSGRGNNSSKKKKRSVLVDDLELELDKEQNTEYNAHLHTNAAQKISRLTHSSLNDVRRHYARMFTNCVNSSDLSNVDSYFNTFMSGPCKIVVNHRVNANYGIPIHMDAVGPRMFAHYLLGCYVTFPDLVIKLNDSKIITSKGWKGTKIVMEVEAHCTKIYDLPQFKWDAPVDELSCLYQNMAVGNGAQPAPDTHISTPAASTNAIPPFLHHSTTTATVSIATSPADMLQSTMMQAGLRRAPPLTVIPQSYVERLVQNATLVAQPTPLLTKGIFTLFLDENHCMQHITIDHWQQNATAGRMASR